MLFLTAAEVDQALPMSDLIAATKNAFQALSKGDARLPLRSQIELDEKEGAALFMPAYLAGPVGQDSLTLKAVTAYARNPRRGLPTIHAAVLVLNPDNGQIEALLEGGRLTALRTGAASGAATDLLANEETPVAALFGAGVQGRTQLQAVSTVRDLKKVWVYDRSREQAEHLIAEMAGQGSIPAEMAAAETPRQAVREADLICTATTSTRPVFDAGDLKPGVHINGVGSYRLDMIEIPPQIALQARVFVGSREGVLAESGEIAAALAQGLLEEKDLIELGEVLSGLKPGRKHPEEITFFKSVGVAVQDAAAAGLALNNARKMGLGQHLNWQQKQD